MLRKRWPNLRHYHTRLTLLTLAAVLSGCGGNNAPQNVEPPPQPVTPSRASTLYVSAAAVPGSIVSVPALANGTVAARTDIFGPNPLIAYNFFVSLDAQGRTWTSNCLNLGGSSGPLDAFAPRATGNVKPVVSIGGSNTTFFGCQTGIAFDSAGNVYAGDIANRPPEFPGGHIAIFGPHANGNVAPERVIAGPKANFHSPTGIALDAFGDLYVADSALGYPLPGDVQVFAAGASGNALAERTIAGPLTGIETPEGIAFDLQGNLYVANTGGNSITVYAPGATGNVAPIRTIAGPNTLLASPVGIAIDNAGYVYVGNQDFENPVPVLVFGPGANGNATPVQQITITATRFFYPAGIAIR